MRLLLCLALALCASAAAVTSFSASISITADPNVWGTVTGTMYYFYDGPRTYKRIDYTGLTTSVTELVDYASKVRYLKCSTCQAETFKNAPEQFFPLDSDVAVGTTTVGGCLKYSRSDSSDLAYVWADKTAGTLCAAIYSSGKRIDFSYLSSGSLTNSSSCFSISGWSCPAKVCNIIMDLVLVMDESGSISSTAWTTEMNFAKSLISQFTISTAATMVGIIHFSTTSHIVSQLDGNSANLNNLLTSAGQDGGNTCMGCGVMNAVYVFGNYTRKAMVPKRVMLFLTDGNNNQPTSFYWSSCPSGQTTYRCHLLYWLSKMKAMSPAVTPLSIGVGTAIATVELNLVASLGTLTTGASNVYTVPTWDQLKSIINSLVSATCEDFPDEPCGTSCRGFCSCGGTCLCPSSCPTLGKCASQNCTVGSYWSGCKIFDTNCDDNNACTIDSCNNATGCHHTDTTDDSDPCTDDTCDKTNGPLHTTHVCDDNNACTINSCTTGVGCDYTVAVNCDDNQPCTVDTCNTTTGCVHTPKSCDDKDACTADSCTTSTGVCLSTTITCTAPDKCSTAKCDTTLGCVYESINCEDGDPCTNNTCIPETGCMNATIKCDKCVAHPPTCTKQECKTSHCEQPADQALCVWVDYMDDATTKCNSNNWCIVDTCASDVCTHTPKATYIKNCKQFVCNAATKSWDVTELCVAQDSCHVAVCDNATNTCTQQSACQDENCKVVTCTVTSATTHTCNKPPLDCSSGSLCYDGSCNATTGKCYTTPVVCNDHSACTTDSCDASTGCVYTNLCDDKDPCTNDSCVAGACVHKPKCDDRLKCTNNLCASDGTCSFPQIACNINISSADSSCYKALCSEQALCYKAIISGAFSNPCGACVDRNAPDSEKNSNVCIGDLTVPAFAGALAGGVIAGIIIAAIIGFILFSILSALGTYKLVMMSRAGKDLVAHNNPTYKPSDNESVNPAYTQR